jgi:hypothetical protein
MTSEIKQLEGLGRLLKAAGVKPAGAEQMIREHLDSIQEDGRQQHAQIVETVRTLEQELVEFRHNHAFALAEIRIATDMMRRDVEASNWASSQTLRRSQAAIVLLIVMQIAIIAILFATSARDLIRWPESSSALFATNPPPETGPTPSASDPAPTQIKR